MPGSEHVFFINAQTAESDCPRSFGLGLFFAPITLLTTPHTSIHYQSYTSPYKTLLLLSKIILLFADYKDLSDHYKIYLL